MIPENINAAIKLNELDFETFKQKTYKLDFDSFRISSMINGYEASYQAVKKILMTERFYFNIYSAEYGVELDKFIGANIDYAKSELQRQINDALMVDSRVVSVQNFSFEYNGGDKLLVNFEVTVNDGSFPIAMEVVING